MEIPIKKRGIIYCRVSSIEQVENTSLTSQEKACRDYAKRENIEIITEPFIEKGESAKTANRTEFNKAIIFCSNKQNKVDYFIVYKVDRFARNQDDHSTIRAVLKRYNTFLRSVTEPIDETPTGRLMEGIIASVAEFDNSIKTLRSIMGMEANLEKGIWVWPAPVGYYRPVKGSNIAPDKEVAPYIVTIFEEWSKGIYTYDSLSRYLTKLGFKTKTGKEPCPQLIEKILKNPIYCGLMKVWNKEHIGRFEPIISPDLFARCQKDPKRYKAKVTKSRNNPNFPLRRICICTDCNIPLTGSLSTGRKNVKYAYYHHHKQNCSQSKSIPKQDFEELFIKYLNKINPTPKYEKALKVVVMDIWENNYKKLNENNVRIKKAINELEQDRQKIFNMHRSGIYSDHEFQEQKNIINKEILQKQQLFQNNYLEEFDMEEALNYCFSFIRETGKTWLKLKTNNYTSLMRFQKQLFPENITFDGKKFGTTKIPLIYKLNEEYTNKKSNLG